LRKADSLYNYGMLPLIYSTNDMKWSRGGNDVCYYRNFLGTDKKSLYTLTFSVRFDSTDDIAYLAHCFPYTLPDLHRDIREIVRDPIRTDHIEWGLLCWSLGGRRVDLLTITDRDIPNSQKKVIVLSARVHPGETNASWMCRGIIERLTGESAEASELRQHFIFYVVPMVNPDGVMVGNYRCSLAGLDLNRQWQKPRKRITPECYALKKLLISHKDISVYIDLHGHSRKKGSFFYGCSVSREESMRVERLKRQGKDLTGIVLESQHSEKMIPYLMHGITDHFDYSSSSFHIDKSKAGTGRVVGWKEIGINNCYTLEASFCGSSKGPDQGKHFGMRDLEGIGVSLISTIYAWHKSNESPEIQEAYQARLEAFLEGRAGQDDGSDGSDSDPCEGNLAEADLSKIVEALVAQQRRRENKRRRNHKESRAARETEEKRRRSERKTSARAAKAKRKIEKDREKEMRKEKKKREKETKRERIRDERLKEAERTKEQIGEAKAAQEAEILAKERSDLEILKEDAVPATGRMAKQLRRAAVDAEKDLKLEEERERERKREKEVEDKRRSQAAQAARDKWAEEKKQRQSVPHDPRQRRGRWGVDLRDGGSAEEDSDKHYYSRKPPPSKGVLLRDLTSSQPRLGLDIDRRNRGEQPTHSYQVSPVTSPKQQPTESHSDRQHELLHQDMGGLGQDSSSLFSAAMLENERRVQETPFSMGHSPSHYQGSPHGGGASAAASLRDSSSYLLNQGLRSSSQEHSRSRVGDGQTQQRSSSIDYSQYTESGCVPHGLSSLDGGGVINASDEVARVHDEGFHPHHPLRQVVRPISALRKKVVLRPFGSGQSPPRQSENEFLKRVNLELGEPPSLTIREGNWVPPANAVIVRNDSAASDFTHELSAGEQHRDGGRNPNKSKPHFVQIDPPQPIADCKASLDSQSMNMHLEWLGFHAGGGRHPRGIKPTGGERHPERSASVLGYDPERELGLVTNDDVRTRLKSRNVVVSSFSSMGFGAAHSSATQRDTHSHYKSRHESLDFGMGGGHGTIPRTFSGSHIGQNTRSERRVMARPPLGIERGPGPGVAARSLAENSFTTSNHAYGGGRRMSLSAAEFRSSRPR